MSQHGCPERLPNVPPGFAEEGPREPTMEVLVETLTGTAFEMTVSPSDTVLAIKTRIFRVEGIPVSQQHLLYNLSELSDGCSLSELGISEGARLRLVLGLRGGPISTRRLPPPATPWPDIERLERLLDTSSSDGAGGGGCKVTVLVFRDGERVSVLRVRENEDGTYSPVDHPKYTSSLKSLVSEPSDDGLSFVQENAVTMGKMLELRRRMEALCVRRGPHSSATCSTEKPDVIQKTRSEETLTARRGAYDLDYSTYDLDCAFADSYTLLPPIGTRADSDQSVADSDLAGSILVKRDDEASILEESVCLEGATVDECLRQDSPQLAAKNLAPIPTAEYGPLIVGSRGGWRGFGSSSQLRAAAAAAAAAGGGARELSSSSPDLELLQRGRLLPALSRHRHREHLHLSDDGLDVSRPRNLEVGSERRQRRQQLAEAHAHAHTICTDVREDIHEQVVQRGAGAGVTAAAGAAAAAGAVKKVRVRCALCRKRLSIATAHTCRCGGDYCAPHRYAEVHGCLYDYKRGGGAALARANPLVSAPKLPKI